MITRRGFLSLVSTGAAAAVVERTLPAAFRVRSLADPEQRIERFVMSFSPELGFQEIVGPGGSVRLVALAQLAFRPDRLILPSDAAGFNIAALQGDPLDDGLALAMPNQFLGEVPAEFFGPSAFGMRMAWAAVSPGEEIILDLVNRSGEEREIRGAALVGLAVR